MLYLQSLNVKPLKNVHNQKDSEISVIKETHGQTDKLKEWIRNFSKYS